MFPTERRVNAPPKKTEVSSYVGEIPTANQGRYAALGQVEAKLNQ